MNIFVILIMGIMLATYQYFTAKRSSDVVLNKDELKLQAELTCLKQFHEFAASKNEFITNSESDIISLKGDGENQVNYTCNGSDDETLKVSKYCLDASGQNLVNCSFDGISCDSTSAVAPGYHCVSTTKWKKFETKDKYLMSQILKTGVYVESNQLAENLYLIKDKGAIFAEKPTEIPEGTEIRGVGMVSCVNACKVNLQTKLQSTECKEGEIIVPRDDGTFTCAKPTDVSPCTIHERESNQDGPNCTKTNNKFCCPITYYHGDDEYCKKETRPENCCPPSTKYTWDSTNRRYICSDGTDACPGEFPMKIQDEKGQEISALGSIKMVASPATPKYEYNNAEHNGDYICNLTYNSFVDACKNLQSSDYSFIKVSNITNNTKLTKAKFAQKLDEFRPICHLASKENAKSAENCSPCQGVEFDTLNNKWRCKSYTDFKTWSQEAKNVIFAKKTGKGAKSCLSTCSNEQIEKIKAGERNGKYWGLRWDNKSKMWNCFNCKPQETYNYVFHCSGGAPCVGGGNCPASINIMDNSTTHKVKVTMNGQTSYKNAICNRASDWKVNENGKCIPYDCASEFQVQINGICYTKWCSKGNVGFPAEAEINNPKESTCPQTSPWMTYNNQLKCVYCLRPPPLPLD